MMLTLVIPSDLENKYLQVEYVSKGKEKYYIGNKKKQRHETLYCDIDRDLEMTCQCV